MSAGRALAVLVVALAGVAQAHPQGFHLRATFTVAKDSVQGVLALDVDAGERCRLLRAGADLDHDGLLAGAEVAGLKERLAGLILRPLVLGVSGAPLAVKVLETRLSLREDRRAQDGGLSVAVLLEATLPRGVFPGSELELTLASPDVSTVVLEVFQASAAGPEAPLRQEVASGARTKVRLGALGPRPR